MKPVLPVFRFTAAWIAAFSLALAGCGGSGGSAPGSASNATACVPTNASTASQCGRVIVALTDAEGEFTSYTVDVLSITLERADGSLVEMLPQSTRVDFAQLSALSELISSTTLVPGVFVGGSIRIDYSDAEIFVETGGAIVPVAIYDNEGTLLTADTPASIVDVAVTLPDSNHLAVRRAGTALLSIDFDLTASHVIDTTTDPVSAVAQPYLVAEVQPVDEKELRVRGALVSVDESAGTYDVRLRPWYHEAGDYGAFTVRTTGTTEFEIDDTSYVGASGLTALAAEPAGTLTVAFGTLDVGSREFTAEIVHAGDSVGGTRFSAVLGNIVSRNGDQLVMKGALAIRRDHRSHFQRTVVVNVGPDTQVTRIGEPDGAYDKDDLSVGQRAVVFGEFANADAATTDPFGPDIALVLDATNGRARMLVTGLIGSVAQVFPGQIDIELRAIDRLSASMFDFAGTGGAPDLDADPLQYEVATGSLPLDAVEVDRPVRVLGFVTAFGTAPPDFEGRTLVGPRDLPAALGIGWGIEGTSAPFTAMNSTSLVLDLANADIGLRHHILLGREVIDLFDLASSPLIEESGPPRIYGIWEPGHVELFESFAGFVDELALRLGGADRAQSLAAYGSYSTAGNTLSAHKIVVYMTPAAAP